MSTSILLNPFQLTTSRGDTLNGDVFIASDAAACPVVIMAHGYTGFKDWGSMPAQAAWFAERGMAAVLFNFSHNGIGGDAMRITDPEKFSKNTIALELDEFHFIVNATYAGVLPCSAQCDRDEIVLLGHSRGGAEAIIIAKESEHVRAVASWGGISYFDRWSDRQKNLWRKEGKRKVTFSQNAATLEMSIEFLSDLERNAPRYLIGWNVATLRKPLLLLHGAQDMTVVPDEAKQLFDVADHAITELVIIQAAGHTFGSTHPFTGISVALEKALETTLDFFRRALAA